MIKDINNGNFAKSQIPLINFKGKQIQNDIITFYFQYNQLKNIYRQGFLQKFGAKAEQCESIADHTFSVSLLCMSIIEKYELELDLLKCLKLCIIHELGEIYAGDFTPFDNISEEDKHELEKQGVEKVLECLEFENDFLKLWLEYENQKTDESIFVKELDKIEFLLQAAAYGTDISYCKRSLRQIKTPIFKDIANELISLTIGNNVPN